MISFAEFLQVVPTTENIELHIIEEDYQFDIDRFDLDETELKYPWYQYHVVSLYSYFDKDENDTIIHLLISWWGDDDNA